MELSESEQRVLAQIEADLSAADPQLAVRFAGWAEPRIAARAARRRPLMVATVAAAGVVGFLAVGLVVKGTLLTTALVLAGELSMLLVVELALAGRLRRPARAASDGHEQHHRVVLPRHLCKIRLWPRTH